MLSTRTHKQPPLKHPSRPFFANASVDRAQSPFFSLPQTQVIQRTVKPVKISEEEARQGQQQLQAIPAAGAAQAKVKSAWERLPPQFTMRQSGGSYAQTADRAAQGVGHLQPPQAAFIQTQIARSPMPPLITSQREDANTISKYTTPAFQNDGTATPPPVTAEVAGLVNHPGQGETLTQATRQHLEPVLNADLSTVRVHHSPRAQQAAEQLGAKAFTHQQDIFLGAGQSSDDLRLLAHEATHVIQQRASDANVRVIQRNGASYHQGVIRVVWSDDDAELYRRIVVATDANRNFSGIRRASMWQPFHAPARRFHQRHRARHLLDLNEGDRIEIHVSGFYDVRDVPGMSQVRIWHAEDIPVSTLVPPSPPIAAPQPPQPQPPQPQPTPLPIPEECSPASPRRRATECSPNPHDPDLPPVGRTHTEAHPLEPCLLPENVVAASPEWCVDAQQAHGGEVCYRQIPSRSGEPGAQYCYSENCCHNSADNVSVVAPTSPGNGSCCESDYASYPGHIWEDVVPELLEDPERVIRDILGL